MDYSEDKIMDEIISNYTNKSGISSFSNNSKIFEVELTNLTSKEKLYYKALDKFFKNLQPNDIQKMFEIIEGSSRISLRLLDWFVTRYANIFKVTFDLENNERFNVHISYKAQLKSYKKRYFDPFKRRKKFIYVYTSENIIKKLCTTIGQLNFFRWAFSNNVIHYVEENYNKILECMIKSNKEDKKRKSKLIKKENKDKDKHKDVNAIKIKKEGINIFAKSNIDNNEIKIILSFE
ncbi:Hypothetical protein KVN_LOCUS484 [uncultured virus]|nr:Hypothetical protein KVN_LOCUS484 [uncultured virus]